MNQYLNLLGRSLLALIFLLAGVGKISDPAGTMHYMESMGLPGLLFWPTVALETLGGLAIVVGFRTRHVAFVLAGFCVVTALVFHRNFADSIQMIMFLKNLAIAGGFLLLAGTGATGFAIDKTPRA